MYKYFYSLLNDLSNIRKPLSIKKITDRTLNIVVAYRDPGDGYRKRQLKIFKSQIKLIFDGKIDYHIYIIEQEIPSLSIFIFRFFSKSKSKKRNVCEIHRRENNNRRTFK